MKSLLKKLTCFVCIALICIPSVIIPTQAANDEIHVRLNDTELSFDVPPQIIGGRTMVPMRSIFEALGYTIKWNQEDQSIMAQNKESDKMIYMIIDNIFMYVGSSNEFYKYGNDSTYLNEHITTLEQAPTIINGRTLVPVRAISEASNCNVEWDDYSRTVIITSDQNSENNFNSSFFEELKYAIISNGTYSSKYKQYTIFDYSEDYGSTLFAYDIEKQSISLSYSDKTSDLKATTMFLITSNDAPGAVIGVDNGIQEKTLIGTFSDGNNEFIKLQSDFSSADEAIAMNLLKTSSKIIDIMLKKYNINVSLSDFGISL